MSVFKVPEFIAFRPQIQELLDQCRERKEQIAAINKFPITIIPGINWLPYIVLTHLVRGGPPSEHFDLTGTTPQRVSGDFGTRTL